MIKFRHMYGFLILLLLFTGFYIAEANGLFPDITNEKPQMHNIGYAELEALAGKGLVSPRGYYSIREIIVAYNLTKDDFYNTLQIPFDYPDTTSVIFLIKDGYATSKQVQAYLIPITDNFKK